MARPYIFPTIGAVDNTSIAILNQYCETFLATCGVVLSAGASLTYNVEYTLEPIDQTAGNVAWTAANVNWWVLTGMNAQTASNVVTISGPVTAVRLNVTGWVSGTARFEVVQSGGIKN